MLPTFQKWASVWVDTEKMIDHQCKDNDMGNIYSFIIILKLIVSAIQINQKSYL